MNKDKQSGINENKLDKCAIIIGSYINACSIYQSLAKIGYDAQIYMFDVNIDKGTSLADIAANKANIVKQILQTPEDIVKLINDMIPEKTEKHFFFTSEEFLDVIKDAVLAADLKNVLAFTGAEISNDYIFDRYKFYKFVEALQCINVPHTIENYENPFGIFGSQFIIRMKRSWVGSEKLPRLSIVHGENELEKIEKDYESHGYTRDMWCYQELLSISDKHNVSVCGWHDPTYQQYAVTRKVVQHPPKIGNGDVVETMTDFPDELPNATKKILDALHYAGPFEMEFVFDLNSNTYKVIELNPRYWMQHGLVEELTDHALVRRNIVETDLKEIPPEALPHRYWVNTNQALFRLAKGQFSMFRYLFKGVRCPGILASMKWAFYYLKYKKQIVRIS
jgi:hypothetical protein